MSKKDFNPFDVKLFSNELISSMRWMSFPLKTINYLFAKLIALNPLREFYERLPEGRTPIEFTGDVLNNFNIGFTSTSSVEFSKRIPKEGPLVIVANHPFGGAEALILAQIVSEVRSDFKFLANFMLTRIPEMAPLIIPVDPFERKNSKAANIQPLKDTVRWLNDGKAVIVFPSGTVSHFNMKKFDVLDPPWNSNIAKIIHKTEATVIPMFVHGRNSNFFQLAGMVHPILRTILLPREIYNKGNKNIVVQIGRALRYDKLKQFSGGQELISYLRFRTYIQKSSQFSEKRRFIKQTFAKKPGWHHKSFKEIAKQGDKSLFEKEVENLGNGQVLFEHKQYVVCHALAWQIPSILNELGRLREIAFRQVGEGTGQALDIDKFDNYYEHLFIFDREEKEIVGAYRLAKSDQIINSHGIKGLYTYSLFFYGKELLDQLGPSLEMGRSFIRPEYQKSFWPLMLLWKGIGHYVARFPEYKTLFGPVSISDNYKSISRQLMIHFLKEHNYEEALSSLVKPRKPLRKKRIRGVDMSFMAQAATNINDISELISEVELKEEKVPVLLKEYIKLGGKLLGFNVDPAFSSVLDGLIMVDLTHTKPSILEKYMGKENLEKFFNHHKVNV